MISPPLIVFGVMLLLGAALSVLFDFIRAFIDAVKPPAGVIAACDIIFWAAAIYAAAACAWNFNAGAFRLYEVVGIILGAVLYFLLLGRIFYRVFLFAAENILKFTRFIFKILLTPLRFLYKILIVPIKNAVIGIKNNILKKVHIKIRINRKEKRTNERGNGRRVRKST